MRIKRETPTNRLMTQCENLSSSVRSLLEQRADLQKKYDEMETKLMLAQEALEQEKACFRQYRNGVMLEEKNDQIARATTVLINQDALVKKLAPRPWWNWWRA